MLTLHQTLTLRDLGERRIVKELIVPRFPSVREHIVDIGDDCAVIPAPPSDYVIVMTTDPCPTPVVCLVDTPDFYHYGRLTMLINISDLAAMGAKPVGLLVSSIMPENMKVIDYERFLDGLSDASNEWSCPIIGGNIKDGPSFAATGSALGMMQRDLVMRRSGSQVGDKVCVVGEMGLFWAAVLGRMYGISLNTVQQSKLDESLYKPVAKIKEGATLAGTKQVTSCMDSSDGITGCLHEIALVNQVDIVIDAKLLQPHPAVREIAKAIQIDARKLMLSWGNWELVCTIRNEAVGKISQLMESLGTRFSIIGETRAGNGQVWLEDENQIGLIANLASERFSATSTFTHGLETYVNFLRAEPLVSY